jgi:metal-responsive CopG/Arc/MetJ family transcriptional regulator
MDSSNSRTGKKKDKGKKMPATAVARQKVTIGKERVLVEFPTLLLKRAEEAAAQLATDRSKFIRSAVEQALAAIERQKVETELAETYAANAVFNLNLSAEFAHVDSELCE